LLVSSDGQGGLHFDLVDFEAAERYFAGSAAHAVVEEAKQFLSETHYRDIRKAIASTLSNGVYATTLRNLTGLGNQLYRHAVPEELKVLVGRLAPGQYLHIVSDDFSIPWELVRNGGDFWGTTFVISHARRTAELVLRPVERRVERILNVIGAEIWPVVRKSANELFSRLTANSAVTVVTVDGGDDPTATEKVYGELGNADIVHFTCHGQVQNGDIYLQIVREHVDMYNLMATSIRTTDICPGSLVLANACISSTTQTAFRQSLSFGSEFCAGGASAFVGTLDFVPDISAILFAEMFYQELFDGRSAGEALLAAKRHELRYQGSRVGMAQLLYSLYGNANAVFSVA
jgi:hypothetical protein